ncbi:hypothetical protein RND81_04G055700 [Saponaria officinalis]|uniref:Uncharacterized protein n=1 Tax=Saponaria officinalis TaxID=3572 RepID=A0AAW1LI08_SAPOF
MKKSLLFSLILCFHFWSSSIAECNDDYKKTENSQVKLFVFGDSYADTGNWNNSATSSWNVPYGMTYPGKPTGRFSDGRILTDYIASYLEIETPIPYEQWNLLSSVDKSEKQKFGMNYAYGGTGVFNTDVSRPNMTSQIDILERLITQSKVYTKPDFLSSIALVSIGGNDYSYYLKHPSNLTVSQFTKMIINQFTMNLERIQSLGIQKIGVTKMGTIGCLPAVTSLSEYKSCTQGLNAVAASHNILLQQSVDLLNKKTKDATFFTLDLYNAFMTSLQSGTSKHESILKPCCEGVTANYECGNVEGNVAKYTVCEKPGSAFFWDKVHPAQNGWYQVYVAIQPTLKTILNTTP